MYKTELGSRTGLDDFENIKGKSFCPIVVIPVENNTVNQKHEPRTLSSSRSLFPSSSQTISFVQ